MTPANILLVDDQPDNLLALEAVLAPLNQNLVRASSGDEALKLLLKDRYAVILLDVHMPGLDGFETAALIKQRSVTRHLPIIFVTAESKDTEQVFRGYSEGAVDYLLKPYDPAVLRSKVAVFVDLFEKEAALAASEKRFRMAFANAPAGTALADPDGRLLRVNAALADLLGTSEAELLDQHRPELLQPGERALTRPDGTELLTVVSVNHVDSEQLIVQVEDVTQRRAAETDRAARTEAEAMARMVRSLQSVSDTALSHLALDDLLPELLARVRDIMSADGVSVHLTDPGDETRLELRCTVGVAPTGDEASARADRTTFTGRVARERHVVIDGPVIGVPLVAEGSVRGVLSVRFSDQSRIAEDEQALLSLIADRAALAIGNARMYEREHRVVETLQRSLLPASLPREPGVAVAARYRPGGADVGGDWYDALSVGEGAVGLAMGDVVGHGLAAAAMMGELRNALRAYAVEDPVPASVVRRLDRLLREGDDDRMATLLYAIVDNDEATVRYVSAGHPPPLLIEPGGDARFLWDGRTTPLGVGVVENLQEGRADFPAGSALVLYTDGLVEVPGEQLDEGLERLREAALRAGPEPDELCRSIEEELCGDKLRDDTALLVLRTAPMAESLTLDMPIKPASLRRGRRLIARWLEHSGAAPDTARDILLACHEACANAAEHAGGDSHFRVEASRQNGTIELTVRDSGSWREPLNGHRGRGLDLMRALMDDVNVDTGPDGTVVSLSRSLSE